MGEIRIALLPGLDGTGTLFSHFIAAAPPNVSLRPIALPAEALGYRELADRTAADLAGARTVLMAESFSGPLAVALAERHQAAALVFCNSFVAAPRSGILRWVALPASFGLPFPRFLLRRYLLDGADDTLVREVAEAISSVPAGVIAHRIRTVLTVDETQAFSRCTVPTLYVRGTADRLIPESAWRRMAAVRQISTARVAGPHLLMQVNPVGVWNALLPFLNSFAAV